MFVILAGIWKYIMSIVEYKKHCLTSRLPNIYMPISPYHLLTDILWGCVFFLYLYTYYYYQVSSYKKNPSCCPLKGTADIVIVQKYKHHCSYVVVVVVAAFVGRKKCKKKQQQYVTRHSGIKSKKSSKAGQIFLNSRIILLYPLARLI